MIDWNIAQRIAALVAGRSDTRRLEMDLQAACDESRERVIAYTGITPCDPIPPAEEVARQDWIRANIRQLRALLDHTLRRVGKRIGKPERPVRLLTETLMTAEIGVILGFLSQRVLGQYDVVLLDGAREKHPPRLLFVLPNLREAGTALGASESEFVTWVALHEITHAIQFAGVPWLRGHMATMLRRLLDGAEISFDARRVPRFRESPRLKWLTQDIQSRDFMSLVVNPRERATLDQVQATMSVIEGYAEHVMDAVGAPLLPSLPRLRAGMDGRRRSQSAATRLLMRLLGLDMKMRQYEKGKEFCDAVVNVGGVTMLNRLWEAPGVLPSLVELGDPGLWMGRVCGVSSAV